MQFANFTPMHGAPKMEQGYWSMVRKSVSACHLPHKFPPLTIKVSGGRVGGVAPPLQLLRLLPGTLEASDWHCVEEAVRLLQVSTRSERRERHLLHCTLLGLGMGS